MRFFAKKQLDETLITSNADRSLALIQTRTRREVWQMDATSIISFFVMVGRLLTAGVLIIAAVAKLLAGPDRFSKAILGYDLVSQKFAWFLALWLPWVEIVCGALLGIGLFSRITAIVGSGLFLLFCAAIAISLLRGRKNDCGCFRNGSPVQWRLVYRDLTLFGILIAVYTFEGGALALDGWIKLESNYILDPWPGFWGLMLTWLVATSATVLFQCLMHFKLLGAMAKGEPI